MEQSSPLPSVLLGGDVGQASLRRPPRPFSHRLEDHLLPSLRGGGLPSRLVEAVPSFAGGCSGVSATDRWSPAICRLGDVAKMGTLALGLHWSYSLWLETPGQIQVSACCVP